MSSIDLNEQTDQNSEHSARARLSS